MIASACSRLPRWNQSGSVAADGFVSVDPPPVTSAAREQWIRANKLPTCATYPLSYSWWHQRKLLEYERLRSSHAVYICIRFRSIAKMGNTLLPPHTRLVPLVSRGHWDTSGPRIPTRVANCEDRPSGKNGIVILSQDYDVINHVHIEFLQ